jgi:hypothetical protein
MEDDMDYADAGDNAYTANQVVSNAYTLVFNAGMFPEAWQDWRKLPADEKARLPSKSTSPRPTAIFACHKPQPRPKVSTVQTTPWTHLYPTPPMLSQI